MLVARVTPASVTIYRTGNAPESAAANLEKARAVIAEQGYRGEMNDRTAARVKRILRAWFTEKKCKKGNIGLSDESIATSYTFVTLTLPAKQVHTDNELKRFALRPFLQDLGRKFGAVDYLWKAEPQENGNVHFHILLEVFIPWQDLRKLWNHHLEPLDYIDQYRQRQQERHSKGMVYDLRPNCRRTPAQQLAAYVEGVRTNWSNPNTTDIHSLRKVKHIIAYISAYITKKADRRKIEGRIWDCTDHLRGLQVFEREEDGQLSEGLRALGEGYGLRRMVLDHCTVYSGDILRFLYAELPSLATEFVEYWKEQTSQPPERERIT